MLELPLRGIPPGRLKAFGGWEAFVWHVHFPISLPSVIFSTMRHHLLTLAIICVSTFSVPLRADDLTHWWLRDESTPGQQSFGDVRRAALVKTSQGQVSLFTHTEEKFVLYWASKDPKTIEAARLQLERAPSEFLNVGGGTFVRWAAIDSIQVSRDSDGPEKMILQGTTVELATVTDPAVIKQVRQFVARP